MFKLNGGSYPFVLLAIVVLASLSMHRSWSGTGFTMALFIASPAVDGDLLNNAKIGVLSGSVLSAIVGMILLVTLLPKPAKNADN